MSLVSTYVKLADGKYYQDPVFGEDDWFICYDDDDPIELVIRESSKKTVDEILQKMENKFTIGRMAYHSFRCFGNSVRDGMYPAVAFWLRANGNPPVKFLLHHGEVLNAVPERDCVIYDHETRRG